MILVRHAESEWNRHFAVNRVDPGIRDPSLSRLGREQAARLVDHLAEEGVTRLIASPYRRTLETAHTIADALRLPVSVEPLVREQCVFSCDIGSPPEHLKTLWPKLDFAHLDSNWWGEPDESHTSVRARAHAFRDATHHLADRTSVAVISHWAFIRSLTGAELENATYVRLP